LWQTAGIVLMKSNRGTSSSGSRNWSSEGFNISYDLHRVELNSLNRRSNSTLSLSITSIANACKYSALFISY
jgi:hypothetical protein